MISMWVGITFGLLFLMTYMFLVKRSIDKKFTHDPDCVTCNGWPVILVYYTWGYFGDWFPREQLCIKHQIQGQRIAYLEVVVLDNELPV